MTGVVEGCRFEIPLVGYRFCSVQFPGKEKKLRPFLPLILPLRVFSSPLLLELLKRMAILL